MVASSDVEHVDKERFSYLLFQGYLSQEFLGFNIQIHSPNFAGWAGGIRAHREALLPRREPGWPVELVESRPSHCRNEGLGRQHLLPGDGQDGQQER